MRLPNSGKRWARLRVAAGVLVIAVAWPGAPAQAGPFAELQHRYPCTVDGREVGIVYETRRDMPSVGVELRRRTPVFVVNERELSRRPFEVVAFEFFSACEQAHKLARAVDPVRLLDDPDRSSRLVLDADCQAMALMSKQGVLRGSRDYSRILADFNYERAKQSYLGVSFDERADNIRRFCPY